MVKLAPARPTPSSAIPAVTTRRVWPFAAWCVKMAAAGDRLKAIMVFHGTFHGILLGISQCLIEF
jgi:hypothetical protein